MDMATSSLRGKPVVPALSTAANNSANAGQPNGQSNAASLITPPTVASTGDRQTLSTIRANSNGSAALSAMPALHTGSSVQQTSAASVPSAQIDFGRIANSIHQISVKVREVNEQLLVILQQLKSYAVNDPDLRGEITNLEADIRQMQRDGSSLEQKLADATRRVAYIDSRLNTGLLPQSTVATPATNNSANPPVTGSSSGNKRGAGLHVGGSPTGSFQLTFPPPSSIRTQTEEEQAEEDEEDFYSEASEDDDEVPPSPSAATSSTPNGGLAPTGSKSGTSNAMSEYSTGPQPNMSASRDRSGQKR